MRQPLCWPTRTLNLTTKIFWVHWPKILISMTKFSSCLTYHHLYLAQEVVHYFAWVSASWHLQGWVVPHQLWWTASRCCFHKSKIQILNQPRRLLPLNAFYPSLSIVVSVSVITLVLLSVLRLFYTLFMKRCPGSFPTFGLSTSGLWKPIRFRFQISRDQWSNFIIIVIISFSFHFNNKTCYTIYWSVVLTKIRTNKSK